MSNIDDFIIHSQYPVEKIVWTTEGIYDNTNPNWHSLAVFEPLPNTLALDHILVDGVWTNDDWATQYPINCSGKIMGYIPDGGGSYTTSQDQLSFVLLPENITVFGYTTDSQCAYIYGSSYEGRTLKYRLWACIEESDWTSSSTTKTAETLSHSLQKDTSLAQLNMISENKLTIQSGETKTLNHGLGFRPLCRIWRRSPSSIGSAWGKSLQTDNGTSSWNLSNVNKITIDTSNITIYAQDPIDGDAQEFLIRIYNYDTAV